MKKWNMPLPIIDFNPPVYQCPRVKKAFTLDGNLDKPFWEDVPYTQLFMDIEGETMPTPRFATKAKMQWDDDNLYIGAILEGTEIWGHQTERDSVIFFDNDFEIFIDPDSDTHQYFEFEMNAKNTVWDLFLTKPYRDHGKPLNGWDIHGLETAVKIDGTLNDPSANNKRWMVEVVIPFPALYEMARDTKSPKAGDYYRMNFSRVQWDVEVKDNQYEKCLNPKTGQPLPEQNWVWSPTGVINIHYPEHWGFVFFTEADEVYEIPEKEYISYELRKLYYLEHQFHDQNGFFTTKQSELSKDMTCTIDADIYVTPNTFEMSALSPKDGVKVTIYGDGRVEVEPQI